MDGSNSYTYTYDENGIRTSKSINGVTTNFNTKDGVILSQSDGTNEMYFQYDEGGNPLGFKLDGVQYFYITNQMGDVVEITNASGTVVGSYTYDAWGKVLTSSTEVASLNPIRYRGYYYDTETGYYYLQSRYYDPDICRFINMDSIEISNISKDTSVGLNLFAYCNDDPVNNSDPSGEFVVAVIAGISISASSIAVMAALLAFATAYATNSSFRKNINYIINIILNKTKQNYKIFVGVVSSVVIVSRNSRKYNSNEKHHIVAKRASKAESSREILHNCGININDKCNLVSISKTLHKHLHTNAYYEAVNGVLNNAAKGHITKTTKRYRVQGALIFIGFVLKKAGNLCK